MRVSESRNVRTGECENMKILVIGGSYFFGRVFVMQAAKEHEITVVNRGTYSMEDFGVKQLRGDRREPLLWQGCTEDYDVLVDFCAYEAGDIERVLENLGGKVKQYIFISTVDVYERTQGDCKKEDAPFEMRAIPGEAGAYIAGKVALERELVTACEKRGVQYTVLRPAILYGPFNYAPRESVFIKLLVQQGILPRLTDATGQFQFVYVKDAAEAIGKCLLNPKAYAQAFNLCQDGMCDYELFFRELARAADVEYRELPMTCAQAQEQGILLPFPVTAAETLCYSNEKSRKELGLVYTDFSVGMGKTYRAFKGVFSVE